VLFLKHKKPSLIEKKVYAASKKFIIKGTKPGGTRHGPIRSVSEDVPFQDTVEKMSQFDPTTQEISV
jgi:hypothetical protein